MQNRLEKNGAGWRRIAFLLIASAIAGGTGTAWFAAQRPVFPGEQWERKAPERAGFSAARLAAFSGQAGGAGCVVHGGRMIHEWGDTAFRNDVASSIKPVYAFLALKAVQEGRLASLDDRVVKWAPELAELNPELGSPERAITFRQLLQQTSGYGLEEDAGEAFAYNDYAT